MFGKDIKNNQLKIINNQLLECPDGQFQGFSGRLAVAGTATNDEYSLFH